MLGIPIVLVFSLSPKIILIRGNLASALDEISKDLICSSLSSLDKIVNLILKYFHFL